MDVKPKILFGDVMHKRLFPKVNEFSYSIYYMALPLSKINQALENKYLKLNRWGFLSFYNKDHGDRSGADLNLWAQKILTDNNINDVNVEIILLTMPRVLGYVFNPVSFWYCYSRDSKLRAIIAEVNNTFGESHTYICAFDNKDQITKEDTFHSQKLFHVSPFLQREGGYQFRFAINDKSMGAWIDYYSENKEKQLITVLTGQFSDLTLQSCRRAFWKYPLITIKAILLIHWQALKLFAKRCEYAPKPVQIMDKITKTTQD